MKPLLLPEVSGHSPRKEFTDTSLLYQQFSLSRKAIPASTLMLALNQADDAAMGETDVHGRTLLLAHMAHYSLPFVTSLSDRPRLMKSLTATVQRPDGTAVAVLDPALKLAQTLLDRGVDPWTRDIDGRDALDQACHLMWLPVLERLLDLPGAPDVAALEARRLTSISGEPRPLLHHGTLMGNHVLVELLLARGMDVNALDAQGRTPLFLVQSEAMARTLIDAGADLDHRTPDGKDVLSFWTSSIQDSTTVAGLNRLMTERLRAQAQAQGLDPDSPEVGQARWRDALYEQACTGTKDNVLKLMRTHGFSVDDMGLFKGKPQRLLSLVVRNLMAVPARSPSVAQYLIERSTWLQGDDPAAQGTLFSAWLAALGAGASSSGAAAPKAKLLDTVEALIDARFAWKTPEGMARFVTAFVPWADQQMPRPVGNEGQTVPTAVEYRWNRLGRLMFLGLDRVLMGTSESVGWKNRTAATADLEQQAAADPRIRLVYGLYQKEVDTVRRQVLDPTWTALIDPAGRSYAWAWASLAAQTFLGRAQNGVSLSMSMNTVVPVMTLLRDGDTIVPPATVDAQAVSTAMVLAATDFRDRQSQAWDMKLPEHQWAQSILQPEHPVDSSLPFFGARMRLLTERRPLLASMVEGLMLRQTAEEVNALTADATPIARRRL